MSDKGIAWLGIVFATLLGVVAPEALKRWRRRRLERELERLQDAVGGGPGDADL